jgi:DNA-binding transcriptional MerR regulator
MTRLFHLEDLARLTSYSKRTIRYYVQLGLVERPIGEGRGAHYTTDHLRELLDIRKLTENGLTLDAVRNRLRHENIGKTRGFEKKPGSIQIQSRICLAPGLDILITPEESAMGPELIRNIVNGCIALAGKLGKAPDAEEAEDGEMPDPTAGLFDLRPRSPRQSERPVTPIPSGTKDEPPDGSPAAG